MLSRRLIRIKVLQAVYAFFASGDERPDLKEKQLLESFNRLYDLFIYQLSFLLAVFDFAERRIEENKKKHLPTHEDLHPNTRFIDSRIRLLLENSAGLKKEIEQRKIAWGGESELLLRFYHVLRESEEYKRYMDGPEPKLVNDKALAEAIIAGMLPEFNPLVDFFEEMHLQWGDDYYHCLGLVQRYIQGLKASNADFLPPLFKEDPEGGSEDKEFATLLFRRTIIKAGNWNELIDKTASNWELERIAAMDMHILRMALCEFTEFSSIPVKVTINEYIDISKFFSTPRSRTFINGMLDKLQLELKELGAIRKQGRGLME